MLESSLRAGASLSDVADKTGGQGPLHDLGVPRYRLVHKTPGKPRFKSVPLAPGITYVGRTKSNDIVVESELVSRRHAKIILTDMGVTVHDLDSHNGVFLNGKKVRSTPVGPGDLVYFGDICCTLEPDTDIDGGERASVFDADVNQSSLVSEAHSSPGTDDPAVKSLATLIQATDLLLGADDGGFDGDVLELCRALVGADLAVLVRPRGSELEPTLILREAGATGEAPIRWPLVQKAFEDSVVLFSHEDGSGPLVEATARAAVMTIPVVAGAAALGALYLSRPKGAPGFTERDVETLSAVAHLIGARWSGKARPKGEIDDSPTNVGADESRDTSEDRAHIERLTQELERFRGEGERLLAEREQLRHAIQQLQSTLTALEQRHQRLEAEHERVLQQTRATDAAGARALDEKQAELLVLARERDESAAELARLTDVIVQRESERAQLIAQIEELAADVSRRAHLMEAQEAQLANARDEMGRLGAEAQRLEHAAAALQGQADGLSAAVAAALPESMAARLFALAAGDEGADLVLGERTVLCLALTAFDAWAQTAPPADVKQRLDTFCARARVQVKQHGGTVEQVLGHVHLAVFDADTDGVRAALLCARALLGELPVMTAQAGVHVGSIVLGFFGDGPSAVRAAGGEAVSLARGASEYAQPGATMVTEGVRARIAGDAGMMLVNCGPHMIRGIMHPVNLYMLATGGQP